MYLKQYVIFLYLYTPALYFEAADWLWIGTRYTVPNQFNANLLIDEFKGWDFEQVPEAIEAVFQAQWTIMTHMIGCVWFYKSI